MFTRTYIRVYNRKTGDWEDIDFPDVGSAFDAYWELTEKDDPNLKFELITSCEPAGEENRLPTHFSY